MSAGYTPLRQDVLSDQGRTLTAADLDKQISEIFISPRTMNSAAPIVMSEIDDSDTDDRQAVSHPHTGVDDDFLDRDKSQHSDPSKDTVPDIEVTQPDTPNHSGNIPNFMSRLGPDGDNTPGDTADKIPDATDGSGGTTTVNRKGADRQFPNRPNFLSPGYALDTEMGSMFGDVESSIPDVNIYQHKKTLAQGMMDLALFSANANQLRYVLESFSRHPYYYPSVVLISISILLQIAVGVGLIWNATYNVRDKVEICIANKINNFTIIGIFLITVINVFISAFGVATPN